MNCAVQQGLLKESPIASLRGLLPKKRARVNARREALGWESLERIVSSATIAWRDRMLYLVIASCGLRIGEALALRVRDIDWNAPILAGVHVEWQWSRKRGTFDPIKGGGTRAIPICDNIATAIRRWIDVGLRAHLGRPAAADDLLFSNGNGRPLNDRRVLIHFHRDLKFLGFEVRRTHSLRHSFVSALLDAGVPKDVVAQFTHPASYARPIDTYSHYSWRILCEAIQRIVIHLYEPTDQLELFPPTVYRTRRGLAMRLLAVSPLTGHLDLSRRRRRVGNAPERTQRPVATLQQVAASVPAEEAGAQLAIVGPEGHLTLRDAKAAIEREYILRRLEETCWNITRAAELLGIVRTNLHKKLRQLGVKKIAPAAAAIGSET